jgi:hypothetical protein
MKLIKRVILLEEYIRIEVSKLDLYILGIMLEQLCKQSTQDKYHLNFGRKNR